MSRPFDDVLTWKAFNPFGWQFEESALSLKNVSLHICCCRGRKGFSQQYKLNHSVKSPVLIRENCERCVLFQRNLFLLTMAAVMEDGGKMRKGGNSQEKW
jgi:hypothetical protein